MSHISVDAAVVEPGEPDGLRLARTLRALDVPVLFTSIFPPDKEKLALAPAAYLVKPFPLYALERALEAALETQAAPQNVAAV
jgi:DNA-binding response OmpR family regulator